MRTAIISVLALAAGSFALDCNGNSALCDRAYSHVTFVGSHNAPFHVDIPGFPNQHTNVTAQLNQGVRFLQAATKNKDGVAEMCHTSCDTLDAGTLEKYLEEIKSWVDANANEVVTLLLTNGDAINITKFDDAFKAAGLYQYVFTPKAQLGLDDWPTLGKLINDGTRVIVLMDYHADTSEVPYILDEFNTYYFETPFDPIQDQLSSCGIDRPPDASADGRMILANHNLNYKLPLTDDTLIPEKLSAIDTNSVKSIMAQVDTCVGSYKRYPNVVLLDWISVGDAMKAQNQLNGI
ncbi:Uu.00g106260.m01.CDS01 [Anthostomella pinea]|uniref:Uu.00g106260.m01.CDS01 n=1 Tax=Anthostomella pinea TaxID=933095 RepID=A0AAI8VF40_9PEZI|nr:Uu.00g106260.m01.CDS01 [Anthostomella pinea]